MKRITLATAYATAFARGATSAAPLGAPRVVEPPRAAVPMDFELFVAGLQRSATSRGDMALRRILSGDLGANQVASRGW